MIIDFRTQQLIAPTMGKKINVEAEKKGYKKRLEIDLKRERLDDWNTKDSSVYNMMMQMMDHYRDQYLREAPKMAEPINLAVDEQKNILQSNWDRAMIKGEVSSISASSDFSDDAGGGGVGGIGGLSKPVIYGGVAVALVAAVLVLR